MTEQKKRGRPRKDPMVEAVEKKRKPTVEEVRAEWEQQFKKMQSYYDEMLANTVVRTKAVEGKLASLEHQAVGYRAVISYLENTIERLVNNSVRGN